MKVQDILKLLRRWKDFRGAFDVIKSGSWPLEIEGAQGGLLGFFVAEYSSLFKESSCLVVPTEREIEAASRDLEAAGLEYAVLPWWGTMPYRPAAAGSAVFAERAGALASIAAGRMPPVLLMTQRAFLTPVPDPSVFAEQLVRLDVGSKIDPVALAEKLAAYGYTRVPRISLKGEFAMRGEVFDVFLPGGEAACRVLFEFNRIEEIRLIDAASQTSLEKINEVNLYPAREVLWTEERLSALYERLKECAASSENVEDAQWQAEVLMEGLQTRGELEGEEMFFPLSFERPYSVLDYLSLEGKETPAIFFLDYDRQKNAVESLRREYSGLYAKAAAGVDGGAFPLLVPKPSELLLDFDALVSSYKKRLLFRTLHSDIEGADVNPPTEETSAKGQESSYIIEESLNAAPTESAPAKIALAAEPARNYFANINYFKEELESLIAEGWTVCIFAETENQAARISALLAGIDASVLPLNLSAGFSVPALKLLVIQENEIFGRRRRVPPAGKKAKSAQLDTFVELNPGDYVVHVQHGIGRFLGIERVKAAGTERDYIRLEYAEEETVFVPIEQVNLVQRYIGGEGAAPKLDRLGSKSWESRKAKARKAAEEIAQRLIDLYSRRKAARGFAFPKDSEWQVAFEAAFPYEETDDQLTCIADVKADMEAPLPMDRLICGDVGYGKTEVAMRAAFKAVMGGKQVAFLAPTTILAEQHFETLKDRFKGFPVNIAQLSRFVPPKEQKETLKKAAAGGVDILVGTHRIIQKDVLFKDLGLMIVDEEQRFGVKDKERLKEMRANIDCLAMSATPIPRTLHMSLLKIRDMSLLATPPQNRHPIETFVAEFSDERVARAIRREAERGGQVFYLHNRIESLEETRARVQSLVPEMLIEVAHGRMSGQELDDIFRRFKMGGFHVLISTAIVENGIDIPNVNTIIIDRADMYGVSQLYQLRGRVGRSYRKAYAYLLYPANKSLSEVAMKRLKAISDFTELGSGFKIAMKDMEIRGAGNLLGKEQSGEIVSVGFDMYLRLLDEAVQRLQNSGFVPDAEVWLELEYSGFIPDAYIPSAQVKMEFYKKIAAITTADELEAVTAELLDRFGPFPDEVSSLLSLAEIRVICKKIGVASLRERRSIARVEFAKVANISIDKVLALIKESGGRARLDPKAPNALFLETGQVGLREKAAYIKEALSKLV